MSAEKRPESDGAVALGFGLGVIALAIIFVGATALSIWAVNEILRTGATFWPIAALLFTIRLVTFRGKR